jgi:hypothetical protein
MSLGRLGRGDLLAVLGGPPLALSLAVAWFATDPADRNAEISLQAGWLEAVAGCLPTCLRGATRAASSERPRKPPGVL